MKDGVYEEGCDCPDCVVHFAIERLLTKLKKLDKPDPAKSRYGKWVNEMIEP